MSETANRRLIFALGLVLAGWGFLLFFENTYFAAPSFGFAPPWWAAWVGQIPLWGFNAIDTVAVAAFLVVLVVAYLSDKKANRKRSIRSARGGIAADLLFTLLILAVVGVVLYVAFGVTFPALVQDLEKFLGV